MSPSILKYIPKSVKQDFGKYIFPKIIEKEKISILFISHDFGIIARMCDEVGVMYKGKLVEQGSKSNILNDPKEQYTISLLESVRALT